MPKILVSVGGPLSQISQPLWRRKTKLALFFARKKSPKFQLDSFTLTYHTTTAKRRMRDKKQAHSFPSSFFFFQPVIRSSFLLLSRCAHCPTTTYSTRRRGERTYISFRRHRRQRERERERERAIFAICRLF